VHAVSLEHARALAESDARLPPIVVHGETYRVIDGMHRVQAAKLNGADEIEAVFFDGDDDEAFILAVESNIEHGLPLSLAERSAAAERIVRARPEWSDRAVALSTGVSAKTIGAIRSRISRDIPAAPKRIGRDGRVRPLDTSAGRRAAAELLASNPDMSLRQIARRSGVSATTVRDVRERLGRGDSPVPVVQRVTTKVKPPRHDEQQPPEQAQPNTGADVKDALGKLRSDPALRFNARGRMLLRLLDPNFIIADGHDGLLAAVPPYWAGELAEIARACASAWQHFATELEDIQPAPDET
jgi:transposase-like protein